MRRAPRTAAPPLHDATLEGLRGDPKELPARWLYDARGSRLYEEIARLPAYYLPRREEAILRAEAGSIARSTRPRTLVELGAGTARNTRLLLDALGTLERFVPLDVSEEALRAGAGAIEAAYPRIEVSPVVGDFERDLDGLPGRGPRLVAFLGSTIGNLHPEPRDRFLAALAATLAPDDAVLLGLDLVKDAARLQAAYDDPGGVTEAFVRNALDALNRQLGATFDQARFAYRPRWEPGPGWMDIALVAREAHTVAVPALGLELAFADGEPLRVEISAKFRRDGVEREAARAGLRVESWSTDPAGDFALALLRPLTST